MLIPTVALLLFHGYISCCLDLTTIAFYNSEGQTQTQQTETCEQIKFESQTDNRLTIDPRLRDEDLQSWKVRGP